MPIQYALEHLVSDTRTTTPIRGTKVMFEPLRTWKSVSGFYWRRFEISVMAPGRAPDASWHTRCRILAGIWHPADE